MNASIAYRLRNAEMLVLAPIYGKRDDAVISRVARKPVASSSTNNRRPAGIPIPLKAQSRLISFSFP